MSEDLIGPLSSRGLVEAMSWKVASLMMRRYPYLTLLETHPGGGQYDCLSLYRDPLESSKGHLDVNRDGRARVQSRFDGNDAEPWAWNHFWLDVASADSIRDIVEHLSMQAGLPSVADLPATTDEVLVYRIATAVLTAAAQGSDSWTFRMGHADSSGTDSGLRADLFSGFPHMRQRLDRVEASDLFGQPGYRFWFLLRAGQPVVAFERRGTAETRSGDVLVLPDIYNRVGRRLWPTVIEAVGSLLP